VASAFSILVFLLIIIVTIIISVFVPAGTTGVI
jgi:hypothetical protein